MSGLHQSLLDVDQRTDAQQCIDPTEHSPNVSSAGSYFLTSTIMSREELAHNLLHGTGTATLPSTDSSASMTCSSSDLNIVPSGPNSVSHNEDSNSGSYLGYCPPYQVVNLSNVAVEPYREAEFAATWPANAYKVYRRRWWVLFVFSMLAFGQSLIWITYSPIVRNTQARTDEQACTHARCRAEYHKHLSLSARCHSRVPLPRLLPHLATTA